VLFQFIRYNLVGIVNTIVGFAIIFSLMFIGISPIMSNLIGYIIGSILSFYLNSKYTFKAKTTKKDAIKFFTILLFSYALNFITLKWLLAIIDPYLAQFFSAIVYTLSSFLLVKFIVFRSSK